MDHINAFIESAQHCTVIIRPYLYHGQDFVAFIVDEKTAQPVIASFDRLGGETSQELWGLANSAWYPVGFGDSIADALEVLELRLATTRKNWDAVSWSLSTLARIELSSRSPLILQDQLVEAYQASELGLVTPINALLGR